MGDTGKWEVGKIAEGERKKLPANALRIVQHLLVCLPDDGRLLWLFGELANAQGDVKTAYEALDQAVNVFRFSTPELKERRALLKEAAEKQSAAAIPDLTGLGGTEESGAESPPARENPFAALGWKGWGIAGVGIGLVVGLVWLQAREVIRRKRRRRTAQNMQ